MRLWHPPVQLALAIDVALLATAGVITGYVAHRLPRRMLSGDGWLLRIRRFEERGRVYEHLAVRKWKDRLPEAGDYFRGGVNKRRLPGIDRDRLVLFRAETVRAELVHWTLLFIAPIFLLWNPGYLGAAMIGYSLLANVPCIIVQRFNRARLDAALQRASL
jgi:glycosyl-4,4'-diaponeurosporenoate acyltransferase